jgi:hypothetical protein
VLLLLLCVLFVVFFVTKHSLLFLCVAVVIEFDFKKARMSNENEQINNSKLHNQREHEQGGTNDDGSDLEDLVAILHRQIKTSDWLRVNNAENFEKANPDLVRAWNDEIRKAAKGHDPPESGPA